MLTQHQLESYDAEISRLQAEGRVLTVAGVSDVAAMLDEIRTLRLKVEKLSEAITHMREEHFSVAEAYLEFTSQHACN